MRIAATGLMMAGLVLGAQEPTAAPLPFHFLKTGAAAIERLLPPPPSPGSPAALADLQAVKQVQAWRTAEQISLAKAVDSGTIWDYREVVGDWFGQDRLPVSKAFFQRVQEDTWKASRVTKKRFARPRPPLQDPSITPCVPLPSSGSYPSGHSLQIYVWAGMLSELLPDQADALQLHAQRLSWARVLGGVHFPTDLTGARVMAEGLLKAFRATPTYREGLEACRKELAAARLKQAG